MAILLTACGGGSIEEAGAQLAKDGQQVMAWDRWVDPKITNPGTQDVACEDGGVKRVFTATATVRSDDPDPDNRLDLVERLIGAEFSDLGYETVTEGPDQSDKIDSRQVKKVREDPEISFTYTMTLPQEDTVAVELEGQTACT